MALLALCGLQAAAAPLVLAVGVNRSSDPSLPTLRYADDDAVAALELFDSDAGSTWLLSELDAETQELHPRRVESARPPTKAELLRAVAEMRVRVEGMVAQHEQPVVHIWLIGHGDHDERGRGFFALQDANLTQEALTDWVLKPLQRAGRIHLLIDACHAESMVRWRARVENADPTALAQQDFGAFERPANVGVVVAARSTQKTFEWEEMHAGIFSALVRAGLRGAANVDGDDAVSYPELSAYVAAALQGIPVPTARPTLMAIPPRMDERASLSELGWFRNAVPFTAELSALGPTRVDDDRGLWLTGGRFEPGYQVSVWLPKDQSLWLRSDNLEYPLVVNPSGALEMGPAQRAAQLRGPVHVALKQGLFAKAYGPAFMGGYLAANAAAPATQRMVAKPSQPWPVRHWPLWLAAPGLGLAGALGALSLGGGALAAFFAWQYAQTDYERTAAEARQRLAVASAVGAISACASVVLLVAALTLFAADLALN